MDYYYINTATEYDEVMNWNGEAFVEYSADVEGIKQYDNMEQALADWDEAIKVARGMNAQSVYITKATVALETMTVSDKVVKRIELKGYKTDKEHFELMLKLTKKARGDYLIKHRDIIEEYVTVWADGRHWGQVTTELEDENSTMYKQVNALILIAKDNAYQIYKADISELSKEARELCVFKALAFMQVEDAKQMKRATTQYGVDWGLVF
jgi:hypothetical protein|nr:MAG TPA: hypothetical protein [Caudoviricetes sp.]